MVGTGALPSVANHWPYPRTMDAGFLLLAWLGSHRLPTLRSLVAHSLQRVRGGLSATEAPLFRPFRIMPFESAA